MTSFDHASIPTSRSIASAAMNRYVNGDQAAFRQLHASLAPSLGRYLLRQTKNETEAQELLQQTLMKLHATSGRFLQGADVYPWAFAIARRLLIDAYRRKKHERRLAALAPTVEAVGETGPDELFDSSVPAQR